jgi:hypothetical protein
MKRFVKLFGIFTLLMSLLLITGCGRYQAFKSVLDEIIYKGTTYVDNPTDASVTFTLDGTSYTVDAHSVKEIDLKEGAHTLVTPKGETKTFTVSQYDMKSILNPTETTYAIWYVQYGEGKVGNVQHGEVTTSIGDDVYVGPMRRVLISISLVEGNIHSVMVLMSLLRKWSMSMNEILMRRGIPMHWYLGKFIDQWNLKKRILNYIKSI